MSGVSRKLSGYQSFDLDQASMELSRTSLNLFFSTVIEVERPELSVEPGIIIPRVRVEQPPEMCYFLIYLLTTRVPCYIIALFRVL